MDLVFHFFSAVVLIALALTVVWQKKRLEFAYSLLRLRARAQNTRVVADDPVKIVRAVSRAFGVPVDLQNFNRRLMPVKVNLRALLDLFLANELLLVRWEQTNTKNGARLLCLAREPLMLLSAEMQMALGPDTEIVIQKQD